MKQKKVTFDDIAKYTGFSKTTISRYFNNPDSLTLENQDKIARALTELNYHENKLAKVLANGKSEFVGVIVPNLYMHYYSEMLNRILSSYEQYGYKFLVFVGTGRKEDERKYLQELLAYKIEGMIILTHTIPSKELASYNIPIVTIEREDQYVSSVNTDNYMGAVQATSLLIKNQCDVLVHINSVFPSDVPAYGRIKGFLDICEKENIKHELFLTELGNTYKENYECISSILQDLKKKYPDMKKGLFMANDTHANVLLNIIVREYGALPDEFRIVGFDNSPIASEAIIPISTVGQQIEKIAAEAVELLVDRMNEQKKRKPSTQKEIMHKKVTPILIRRETTD